MKKRWIFITVILLVAVLVTGCSGQISNLLQQPSASQFSSTSAGGAASPDSPRLSATMTETVTAVPDIATITLGVTTQGSSADEAQKANNTTANAVLGAIKQLGITDQNIQTSNINVYPDNLDPKKYDVQVDYTVTVSPVDNVGKVIDAAISAGANVTYSLTFDIKDRDAVYMQALQKAMASVADKAQKMASAGGLTIDRVLDVEEASQGNVYPMASAAMRVAGTSDALNVVPGQMDVTATVTATYLLK